MTSTTSTMRPPRSEVGVIGWLRKNLFSSPTNAVLTVVGIWIIWKLVSAVVSWAFLTATFEGGDGSACSREHAGACWPFVQAKFSQFMYGRYPEPQRWRVDLTYVLAIIGLVPLMIPAVPGKLFNTIYMIVVFPIAAFFLLVGGYFGLPYVPTELWGGLLVTLVVASVGIAGAFPIGIMLALGRRSKMPIVRWVSVGFIELVRGVPLITVLFMASVMLPLFLPEGITIDKLLRALIMVALFSAAYLAEVIRGGLQAIPRGQFEAADALGLSYPQKMGLIVLPQALRITIPNIVNSNIALFKDTTLVFIVGIFDFLRTIEAARIDPKWATPVTSTTGYAFAAIFYFLCCWAMSRYAAGVERRLATGYRR